MKVNRFGRAAILTSAQIKLLFDSESGFTNPRDKALFGICLYCAARINEACTLLRHDVIGVNGVRNILVIRSHNTKGGKNTREILVHPQLKIYLENYLPTNPWLNNKNLFPGQYGRNSIRKGSADKILRVTCANLNIEGVSTHSFRRTALTQMSDSGIPLRHIQAISGHANLNTLQKYLGVSEKQKATAIESLQF